MHGTFGYGDYTLSEYSEKFKYAPEIPNTVKEMNSTFYGCQKLITAPTIPSSVISMNSTFYDCQNLQGNLVINANPTSYEYCLSGAAQNVKLYLSGSSKMLRNILDTAGGYGNIEILGEPNGKGNTIDNNVINYNESNNT